MFWDNFERICREAGTTPSRACLDLDIGQNRPSNWKKSGTLPKQDELELLAGHLGCTVADFFKDEESRDNDRLVTLFTKKLSDVDDKAIERGRELVWLMTYDPDKKATTKYEEAFQKRLQEAISKRVTEETRSVRLKPASKTEEKTPALDDYERDFIRIYEAIDHKSRLKLMNAVYEFDPENN